MDPGRGDRWRARLLAVLVHAGFVAVLVFGVSWHHQATAPVMAELWRNLPESPTPVPPAPPPPQPEPPKPAPKPTPKPVAKPVPPAKPAPDRSADIALKKQKEKQERQEKLEKQKQAQAQLEKAREQARVEARNQEDLKQLEQSLDQQAQQDQREQAARAATAALMDRYKLAIIQKIRGNTEVPFAVANGTTMTVELTVLPTGEVLQTKVTRSSGNKLYDDAVLRGIMRSQPLPLPDDPRLRREFRTLQLNLTHEK